MNAIRKEKLRILNLVEEIKDRNLAALSMDIAHKNDRVAVYQWVGDQILHQWNAYPVPTILDDLKQIRAELEQMLRDGIREARNAA